MHIREFYDVFAEAIRCGVTPLRNRQVVLRFLEGAPPEELTTGELNSIINDLLIPLGRSKDRVLAGEANTAREGLEQIIEGRTVNGARRQLATTAAG